MIVFFRRPLLWAPAASAGLGFFLLGQAALGCGVSRAAQDVLKLRDKEYVELPADLCQGYSDALLGKTQAFEYGGVICDRNEASYLLLQRLVGYTSKRKAIWRVVQIRTLARLSNDQQSIRATCRHTRRREQPVFAIIETNNDNTTKVLQAWAVDLQQETIQPTQPQLVVCSDFPQ